MEKNPEKFLYIYLQDISINPKICFELHGGPLPADRASFARTAFGSLDKEIAMEDIGALEDIGFFIVTRLLLERRFKRGEQWAMIAYPCKDDWESWFDVDEEIYRGRDGGDFYTFLPLRPFDTDPEKLNTTENSMDPVLWMRTGRILANALL